VEHLIFHHNGREYTVYDALTADKVAAIMSMNEERFRKLDGLNSKSTKKYFQDTDRMVITILRKCFHMTDKQIADMGQIEARSLTNAFIKFAAAANNVSNNR
jgi:hypothetical protein